jgi:hypothetical protein
MMHGLTNCKVGKDYQSTLRNIPEERRFHLQCGGKPEIPLWTIAAIFAVTCRAVQM